MDENKVRQALAYTNTFRQLAYPYLNTPGARKQSLEDRLYMVSLQLSAALAQVLGRDEETLS